MAGARPLFAPHAAYAHAHAHASASTASNSTVGAGADADADDDADVVAFRLLLPRSFGDEDAIRLYAAIAQLRRRTPALQVRVDALEGRPKEDVASSSRQVAVVLGPSSPTRRVEVSSSSGEPLELSPAQEALVSVVDVGGVLHRVVGRGPECVMCLVLVEAPWLEAALGRGALGEIAREAGAEVRVTSWAEDTPPSVLPPKEVVEITGDRTTIRKAIAALSSCLQGDLHAGSSTTYVTTASPMLPWTSSEVPETNLGAWHSGVSTECANSNIPHIDCPQGVTGDVETKDLQQISFRLLCHVSLAGGLIGTKGTVIKGIEVETGASIDVGSPLSGCMERVITISALESPGPQYSKLQSALLGIFDRMEGLKRNGRFAKPECSARVLVLKRQFGCIVGLGGVVIKEMMKSTRARIEILDETDVPACASQYERVLQITGELLDVRDALFAVSEKLRNHAFSSKKTEYSDGNDTSLDIAESTASRQVNISLPGHYSTDNFRRIDHGPSLNEMDSVENSFSAFHLGSDFSELEKPANVNDVGINNSKDDVQKPSCGSGIGMTNSNCGVNKSADGNGDGINHSNHRITSPEEYKLVRGIKTATIIRTTYEIAACGSILYLLYGDQANNLAQLRQITGADITVYDPPPETSYSTITIVISGTPDQAQLALAGIIDLTQQMS